MAGLGKRTRTSLAGKSVLITGAARGIGAELARRAAARGARIALVGLEPEQLAEVAADLGPEHLWVEADVTDADALEAAVQRTVDTFGGLDIVVANAGIAPLTTVMTSSAHALARTIEVNLIGAMLTTHAALPEIAKRRGHVLLISSAAAFTVLPGMSAYCASKAGVERFGDALRLEVAYRGVTVASAHPTWIDTDMVRDTEEALPTFKATRQQLPGPLGAFTSVEDCADALVENLETRGRRVFVPRSVGTVAALRQLVTGVVAEKVAMAVSATRVPQLERDIQALNGREFGANSVGDRSTGTAA
ncbi:SDR family oxidoreductase [Blastococcus saxobsidens]|uniref:Oxidoreductase, short-chain dehydrogenase/reductase family n=1 Tax=Blastococcus saxobsidens (strain DD2) TaxID=1146883 RepID=H6RSU4_BLASD|nr:SDR family oxidoreductase [Blastococcus saxobsidens]CCG03047.1 Oxidoreductase, short-chain dehydrogenase/reductase family [Blastococcus saxobsidens DD2]